MIIDSVTRKVYNQIVLNEAIKMHDLCVKSWSTYFISVKGEKTMHVKKRNGNLVPFDETKILRAIQKANEAVPVPSRFTAADVRELTTTVVNTCHDGISVEEIQDLVERALMRFQPLHFEVVKAYSNPPVT